MTIHDCMLIYYIFIHWTIVRLLKPLKYQFKVGDFMTGLKDGLEIYFGRLLIFTPLILFTVCYLLGVYKILG